MGAVTEVNRHDRSERTGIDPKSEAGGYAGFWGVDPEAWKNRI